MRRGGARRWANHTEARGLLLLLSLLPLLLLLPPLLPLLLCLLLLLLLGPLCFFSCLLPTYVPAFASLFVLRPCNETNRRTRKTKTSILCVVFFFLFVLPILRNLCCYLCSLFALLTLFCFAYFVLLTLCCLLCLLTVKMPLFCFKKHCADKHKRNLPSHITTTQTQTSKVHRTHTKRAKQQPS